MADDPLKAVRNRAALAYASPAAAAASAADVPVLLAALDAVLKLAGDWEAKAAAMRAPVAGVNPPSAAARATIGLTRLRCAEELCEAITRELTGEATGG